MPRARFGKPWDEWDARSALECRFRSVCDRLLHPDLALAGAAASELCCILYTIASPCTGPHLYYACDNEIAEYKTSYGSCEWLITCCHFCTCTWSHWCSCETRTNTLEYRLVELLRRCTASQGQTMLSFGHHRKRKRDARQDLDGSADSFCTDALNHAVRALAMHARAPNLVGSYHDFERNGPISKRQLVQTLFGLLRSERLLQSDEAWANVAICLMETFWGVKPVISVWTDHPRSVSTLLGWPPRWQTKVEVVVDPLGRGEANRIRFCSVDDVKDDDTVSPEDERMISRLLHVARGWPRLGWLHQEAGNDAIGLLWILQQAGPWGVRNLICRDEQMLGRILQQGRRRAVHCGLGDPVQVSSSLADLHADLRADLRARLRADLLTYLLSWPGRSHRADGVRVGSE